MTSLALGIAAVILSAVFGGGALYVLLVEHPARGALPVDAQLRQWKPAYARGTVMQAGLAVAAAGMGLCAWATGSDAAWLAGAVAMAAVIAFTLVVISPVNAALKATEPARASGQTVHLFARWGRLHAVRTAIGLLGLALYVIALLR